MPRLNTGKLSLHYLDHGQGDAVLFLHAFPLHAEMWQAQLFGLADRWRCLALDARGFGGSVPIPEALTMEMLADDCAALLDRLRLERVVLVGLSMGGYAALAFWRRHRQRVRALVLADTRATADGEEGRVGRLRFAAEAVEKGSGWVAAELGAKLLRPQPNDQVAAYLDGLIGGAQPRAIAAAQLGMSRRVDHSSVLPAITCPTLVLVGEQDVLTPLADSQAMAAAIPRARLVTIPGGHLSNLESPTRFTEELRLFLTDLP